VPQVRTILSPNEAILAPRGPFYETSMMQKYSLSMFYELQKVSENLDLVKVSKPQNKKTVQFLVLFMPNLFPKIMETKDIPQSSTFYFKTTINWPTLCKKSEFLVCSINSDKSLNGRITRYLSPNGTFKI
jgi:hypothetical protein